VAGISSYFRRALGKKLNFGCGFVFPSTSSDEAGACELVDAGACELVGGVGGVFCSRFFGFSVAGSFDEAR